MERNNTKHDGQQGTAECFSLVSRSLCVCDESVRGYRRPSCVYTKYEGGALPPPALSTIAPSTALPH